MAPPTVTWRVPGGACTKQPRGTSVPTVAERHHRAHDRLEAHAPVDADDALLDVDGVEAGEGGGVEHDTARVLRRVAVAATETARDQAASTRARESGVDVTRVVQLDQGRRGGRGPAPPGEELRAFGQRLSHGRPYPRTPRAK